MGNDRDHADDRMPSAGSTKDLSTGRNLHFKRQPRLAKWQSPLMAGSTHHARYKRGSIPNDCFYFFSPSRISIIFRKKSLLFRHSTAAAPSGNEFSAGYTAR